MILTSICGLSNHSFFSIKTQLENELAQQREQTKEMEERNARLEEAMKVRRLVLGALSNRRLSFFGFSILLTNLCLYRRVLNI
jgi:hypothetical protein